MRLEHHLVGGYVRYISPHIIIIIIIKSHGKYGCPYAECDWTERSICGKRCLKFKGLIKAMEDKAGEKMPVTQTYRPNLQIDVHYSKKLKEHFDIMIIIECYPLKRCQGCVKLIASKVNCFLNITDLSEVQLCMSSNSWT